MLNLNIEHKSQRKNVLILYEMKKNRINGMFVAMLQTLHSLNFSQGLHGS